MKKLIIIIVPAALLLFSFEAPAQKKENVVMEVSQDDLGNVSDSFQEHFFEALKQKAIENYDRAIKELAQCLAIDPSKPVVYLELGKNHNALGEYAQAATYLEKAREQVPQNLAVLEELYNTYYLSQEFGKALGVVKDLVKIDETYSEDLANLYLLNEKYDEALDLLDELERKWGASTYRTQLRHQVYSRTNNVEDQIGDLQERVEDNPADEKNYLNLIFVYSEQGDVEKAFETARELLEKNPESELVHLALYKFYLSDGMIEEAVNSMKVLVGSREIDELTKYQALNDFLMFVSDNPSLEDDLVEIVRIFSENENNTEVYGQLGTFFLEKGQRDLAVDYFEKALESGKGDFNLYRNVLELQLESKKYQAARDLSEQAIERFPTQALLYLINATALNQLESFREAGDMLNYGLDFVIDDLKLEAEFYRQLAVAYSGLNEENKAAGFRERAAQLEKKIIDE